MISKFALASLAAVVVAEDIASIYPSTLYKRDGGSHSHAPSSSPSSGYGAPEPSYAAPAPSYSAPAPSYQPSYEAPQESYGAPQESYGPPSTGYETPSYGGASSGYGEAASGGLDLTSILIPILALLGLSLLFPTFVTINGTRRKREASDDSPAGNMVERLQDMYMALMESEECMERIACEVGGLVTDAGISKSMTKMAGQFVPKKYTKMMKTFNHGKDCKKNNKCGIF